MRGIKRLGDQVAVDRRILPDARALPVLADHQHHAPVACQQVGLCGLHARRAKQQSRQLGLAQVRGAQMRHSQRAQRAIDSLVQRVGSEPA